jgi:hypothetical protein
MRQHQKRLSRKPRRALRRDQRLRAMHFTQASEPSLASAPHGHARPWRQPAGRECITRSPSSHQCRSSLLSGIQRCAARQSRVPSAPGIVDSCRTALFHSTGPGGPASVIPLRVAHPFAFLICSWREPYPANRIAARAACHAVPRNYFHIVRIAFGLLPSVTALVEPARAGT